MRSEKNSEKHFPSAIAISFVGRREKRKAEKFPLHNAKTRKSPFSLLKWLAVLAGRRVEEAEKKILFFSGGNSGQDEARSRHKCVARSRSVQPGEVNGEVL